jgi:hypothetical protein
MCYIPAGWWHAAFNEELCFSVNEPLLYAEDVPAVSVLHVDKDQV